MLGAIKLKQKLRQKLNRGNINDIESFLEPETLVQRLDIPRPPSRRYTELVRPPERGQTSGPISSRQADLFQTRLLEDDMFSRETGSRRYCMEPENYRHQRNHENDRHKRRHNELQRTECEHQGIDHGHRRRHDEHRRRNEGHRKRDGDHQDADYEVRRRNDEHRRRNYEHRDCKHLETHYEHGRRNDDRRRRDCEQEKYYEHGKRNDEHRRRNDEYRRRDGDYQDADYEHRRRKGDHRRRTEEQGRRDCEQEKYYEYRKRNDEKKVHRRSNAYKHVGSDDEQTYPISDKRGHKRETYATTKHKRLNNKIHPLNIQLKSNRPQAQPGTVLPEVLKRPVEQEALKQNAVPRLCRQINQKVKADKPRQKGWSDRLRVYDYKHQKEIKGVRTRVRLDKSQVGQMKSFPSISNDTELGRQVDWQAGSTRYEVNARLGNIEKSLKDLKLSTRKHVNTRLRKIENSLKDLTDQKKQVNKHKQKKQIKTKRVKKPNRDTSFNKATIVMKVRVKPNKPAVMLRESHNPRKDKGYRKESEKLKKKTVTHVRKRNKKLKTILGKDKTKTGHIKATTKKETKTEKPPEVISCDVHVTSGQKKRELEDMEFCVFDETSIDVNRPSKQETILDTTIEGDLCPPDLRGIVVLEVGDIVVTVVTDWANKSVKSFYSKENQSCYSQIKLVEGPWGLKKLKLNMIGVTVPKSQQILIFEVNPDLLHSSTIETTKMYWGLAVMTSSTLIVGSNNPSCLDEIDIQGNILQSFSNIVSPDGSIENPDCIHITKTGNILLSDSGRKSVMCLTQSGDVIFTFTPSLNQPLLYPSGVVSFSTGDILLADSAANKVIHLQESGGYQRDILASRSNVEKPFGLCVNGDSIYVATRCREVQVYSFT